MSRHGPGRLVLAGALVVVLPALSACGGKDSDSSPSTSAHPTLATPTGSPFQVSFTGPEVANAGETVTATLKNIGRLPDKYQFQPDPSNAATVSPFSVELSPGQSVKVQIAVKVSPLIVNVVDSSAGIGGSEASLSIGSNS